MAPLVTLYRLTRVFQFRTRLALRHPPRCTLRRTVPAPSPTQRSWRSSRRTLTCVRAPLSRSWASTSPSTPPRYAFCPWVVGRFLCVLYSLVLIVLVLRSRATATLVALDFPGRSLRLSLCKKREASFNQLIHKSKVPSLCTIQKQLNSLTERPKEC